MIQFLFVPPLHGNIGFVDELVVCALVLALGLVVFFLAAVFGTREKPTEETHE
ncbi:MAG: hypothetical protein HY327_07035 [Chloroflexi bacterium]|nr:hypothetical protein [Chloroflexota bacterium]